MSEKESQPPGPERTDYDEFFELVDGYARESAKDAGTDGMPELRYGSSKSPYRIFFNQDPWGYKLSVIGNSTKIPLSILGILDEDIFELEREEVYKIKSRGVHRMDLLITKIRILVQGKLMDNTSEDNKGDPDDKVKWDPEVSRLSPDTKSVLPLITKTSHRYRKQTWY